MKTLTLGETMSTISDSLKSRYEECKKEVRRMKGMIASRESVEIDSSSIKASVEKLEKEMDSISQIMSMTLPARKDTYKMLEVCTHHITEDDNAILAYMSECNATDNDAPLNVGNMGYGYAIVLRLVDQDSEEEAAEYYEETRKFCESYGNNLSESFWSLYRLALKEGYRCIYLDCDVSTVIEELEVHDW